MADQRLRDTERAWLNDPDAADAYDVAYFRAGLPGSSPPRRRAGQQLVDVLRESLIRRVWEEARDVEGIISDATWAEAEEVVDRLLSIDTIREALLENQAEATEGYHLLRLVIGIRMERMREQTPRG